jgi:hypothetical protein
VWRLRRISDWVSDTGALNLLCVGVEWIENKRRQCAKVLRAGAEDASHNSISSVMTTAQ